MHIGFVTLWFERGQAYVTQMLRQALVAAHETFILARNGGSQENPMLKTTGEWAVPNLTTWGEYRIPQQVMREWLAENALDLVIFNEENDLNLVWMAKLRGAKTVGIYEWELFDPMLVGWCNQVYDSIICQTEACYKRYKEYGLHNLVRIKWGIDPAFSSAEQGWTTGVRFFHPAGWGGMHARRGTQFVLDAFRKADLLNRGCRGADLLIHTQRGKGEQQAGNIRMLCGTVPRPEVVRMYHEADVAVLPSKWEGLGLTFLEAIGCGLPIITVDGPPMNEFVRDGETGFLCKVAERQQYPGIFVEGLHVDLDDMAEKMRMLARPGLLSRMRKATREFAGEFSFEEFGKTLNAMVEGL